MSKPFILIVDDEHANQFLLEGLLTANGYKTASAGNGEECLQFLKNNIPDLILLDIMMPKMSGTDVLKEMRSSETIRNIPVIMVSAKTVTTDIKEALELGAIDYIRKPFDEVELLARVKVGLRLKQNEDRLGELISQREAFVKLISHDLRSPFAAIYGLAEILMADENLTVGQKESLGYMVESIEFSLDYFNKLLNWTRLENQEIQLNLKRTSIADLFTKVISIYEKKAKEKSIQIVNSINSEIYLEIDPTFFRQVIANLIGNALKYTSNGGNIICSAETVDSTISIIISDDGIGMPEDISNEKLFEDSVITSRKGTNGEKGTGIGLGICKKILHAHQMNLRFNRNTEKGTSFIISSDGYSS